MAKTGEALHAVACKNLARFRYAVANIQKYL